MRGREGGGKTSLSYIDGCVDVFLVNAHSHSHEHVLRPFHHPLVDLEEIRPLQRLRERESLFLKWEGKG